MTNENFEKFLKFIDETIIFKYGSDYIKHISDGKEELVSEYFKSIYRLFNDNKRAIILVKLINNTGADLGDFVNDNRTDKQKTIAHFLIYKLNIKTSLNSFLIGDKIYPFEKFCTYILENFDLDEDIAYKVLKYSEDKFNIQEMIFDRIIQKSIPGKSKYLESLDKIYDGRIEFRKIIYNILNPYSKKYFHILYSQRSAGTGKSTFMNILEKIVGSEFTASVSIESFNNEFVFHSMMDKYLNITDDTTKEITSENMKFLKSITTNSNIDIKVKHKGSKRGVLFCRNLIATNIFPIFPPLDAGIQRRLNVIYMNKSIPEDMELPIINDEEIGHIIYESLIKHGACDLETNDYSEILKNNSVYFFYNNIYYKEQIDNIRNTNFDMLYQGYKDFCIRYSYKPMTITKFLETTDELKKNNLTWHDNIINIKTDNNFQFRVINNDGLEF